VVVAAALVQVRTLGQSERRTGEDDAPFPDQPPLRPGEFLPDDPGEAIPAGPVIPQHVEQVNPSVIVVEKGRIETAAIEINRIGPVAVDLGAGHQVIVEIAKGRAGCAGDRRAAVSLHVGVDEPETAVGVSEIRRPDAAGVGIAQHVQLAGASERTREEAPVHEIA
jgi:hypothetical protein